jgi:hypothetical protein
VVLRGLLHNTRFSLTRRPLGSRVHEVRELIRSRHSPPCEASGSSCLSKKGIDNQSRVSAHSKLTNWEIAVIQGLPCSSSASTDIEQAFNTNILASSQRSSHWIHYPVKLLGVTLCTAVYQQCPRFRFYPHFHQDRTSGQFDASAQTDGDATCLTAIISQGPQQQRTSPPIPIQPDR